MEIPVDKKALSSPYCLFVCGDSLTSGQLNKELDDRGNPGLTKRFCGFDSRLMQGPVIPKTLQMGVVPACIVLTMK